MSEEPDEERKQQRLQDLERYESLYDGAWIEGLLRGLAEHRNNAGDADLARPYLEHGTISVRDAAADVLLRVGAPQDHERLLSYAGNTYGERQGRAIMRLVELRPKAEWLLQRILQLERPATLLTEVLAALGQHGVPVSGERLDELMRYHDAEVRAAALKIAAAGKPREGLEQLLDSYISPARYRFYDVINKLDRLIYAPEPVQQTARHELGLG